MAEFPARILRVRYPIIHRIPEERVVVGLQRRSDTHLVSVRVRGERQQTCVLRGPAEPAHRSSSRRLQKRHFADDPLNASIASLRLIARNASQDIISDTLHEPGSE